MLSQKFNGLRAIWQFDNRWELICDRLFRRNLSIYRHKGLTILVDHEGGDAIGIRDCIASPMYKSLLSQLPLTGGQLNVLDLGANVGGFVLLCKGLGLELGKVVCVELNPHVCNRLRFNLARNLGDCAVSVNAAVAGNDRTLELSLGRGSTGDSIYTEIGVHAEQPAQRIQAVTLDRLVEEHFGASVLDILKMDVEGAEYEILLSPGHERIRQCRYLIMEIHRQSTYPPESIVTELLRLGFEKRVKRDDGHVFLFENRQCVA